MTIACLDVEVVLKPKNGVVFADKGAFLFLAYDARLNRHIIV